MTTKTINKKAQKAAAKLRLAKAHRAVESALADFLRPDSVPSGYESESLKVGDRFINTSSREWRSGKTQGVHTFRYVLEVVSVSTRGVKCKTVKVLSETGRPTAKDITRIRRTVPGFVPTTCTISMSAMHNYINRSLKNGSITLTSE